MNNIIFNAIRNRSELSFSYHGYHRIVEPHCYGITTAGNEALRCYQTQGGSEHGNVPDWKLMLVDEIMSLSETDRHFSSARPGYRKGDKGMSTIFVEL